MSVGKNLIKSITLGITLIGVIATSSGKTRPGHSRPEPYPPPQTVNPDRIDSPGCQPNINLSANVYALGLKNTLQGDGFYIFSPPKSDTLIARFNKQRLNLVNVSLTSESPGENHLIFLPYDEGLKTALIAESNTEEQVCLNVSVSVFRKSRILLQATNLHKYEDDEKRSFYVNEALFFDSEWDETLPKTKVSHIMLHLTQPLSTDSEVVSDFVTVTDAKDLTIIHNFTWQIGPDRRALFGYSATPVDPVKIEIKASFSSTFGSIDEEKTNELEAAIPVKVVSP